MKKVIAVDVDDYLCKEVCWTIEDCLAATPNTDTIRKVNKLFDYNLIIIYTARRDILIPATIQWLRENQVRYHAISNYKLPADFYLERNTGEEFV